MFKHLPEVDSPRRDQFDTQDNDRGSAVKNYSSNEVIWFRKCDKEDASGICSPPLWKTSNPHCQNLTNYSQLSAAAKAQAVARGQEELMEMMKNMPESSYELSLKDIVEHNHLQRTETQQRCIRVDKERPNGDQNNINPHCHFTKEVLTKRKTDVNMKRSGSLNDGGFLLKIVFPFDFRSKGKKRVILSDSSKLASSKVSPRSSSVRSWEGLSWFGENESTRRASTSKGNIKGFGSRPSSSKNSNREQPGGIFLTGCWSVFSFKKNS